MIMNSGIPPPICHPLFYLPYSMHISKKGYTLEEALAERCHYHYEKSDP